MSAPDNDLLEEVSKLYKKFEDEAHDKVKVEQDNYRLTESGQPRNFLKNLVSGLLKYADKRLDAEHQIKLCLQFAADFYEFGEYSLALENFELVLARCDSIPNELSATRYRVEAMQQIVKSNYSELLQLRGAHLAPMVVSKLLLCLQQLRHSLESVFELPTTQQEGLAWLVLNSCKLIMEIGQPLIWHSCGKYVTETILFASISMEAVINLCTVRHMKFRMKMYASAFYSALGHSVTDEAAAVLEHTRKQVFELKEREELDPPVPQASTACLQQCQLDLAVMKFTLDFWKDPDSFSLADAHLVKYYQQPPADVLVIPVHSFADLCASECIRIHLLASGNTNEPFRKRSSCILKGIAAAVKDYVPAASPSDEEKSAGGNGPDTSRVKLLETFSLRGILEGALISLFCSTDGVDTADTLNKLFSLGQEVAEYHADSTARTAATVKQAQETPVVDMEALEQLRLLKELHALILYKAPGAVRAKQVLLVVRRLEDLLFSEVAYRTRAFLRRVSLEIWRVFVYPAIQEILSDLQEPLSAQSRALLAEIAPSLLAAVKVLDITAIEDPVLMGCLALLSGRVQWELGDHRGSIALMQQAIYTMEEHRMGRVDALQHIPEDVRDIFALQRGAFSTRADHQDWFHSLKRLGAHAFAGYGIFGLSSSADRGDQAMSEIQADLVAFYFRCELTYCIQQLAEKHRIRDILRREEKQRTAAADALLKGIKLKPSAVDKIAQGATQLGASAVPGATLAMGTMAGAGATMSSMAFLSAGVNAETLPVVHALRAYCSKNCYYRCILLLEMAHIDSDPERKVVYLHDALSAIEECEGREQLLKESFADLLVMTENARRTPLIVARSHRYVYIAPVGCRKLKKVAYYRVFAKEKGSGTDVSIYNDDIAGCEKRIRMEDLHNLRNSVVRIGPLRPGEQYVFGTAGFTAEDKVSGGLSPTSVVVDAVNPLSTILLWSWLTQSAQELGHVPLNREVSLRVVNRYFMQSPTPESRVVGRGVNLFLYREPSLCMLALQQSSPQLLQCFVDSCLSYESLYQSTHLNQKNQVNWTKDKSNQLAALTSLHRTALVSTVACGIQNYELTLRCVKIGYEVALELIRFDFVHLASYLESPLVVLILALQNTPKRHWGALEHKLYTKLLSHTAKAASMSRNITPVITVLNNFYPEVLSTDAAEVSAARPPEAYFADYASMIFSVQQCIASVHLTAFLNQAKKLAAPLSLEEHTQREADPAQATHIGYLWSMSTLQRQLHLTNTAADLLKLPDEKASAERVQLEKWLRTDRPRVMSDFLASLVQLCKELVRDGRSADVAVLLQRLPICEDFLSPSVVELCAPWKVLVLQSLANILAAAAPAAPSPRAAAAAKKPVKGAPPEPTEEELQAARDALMKVPERFIDVTADEEVLQYKYLGELVYLAAVHSYSSAGKNVNHFPKSTSGPLMHIDPNALFVDRSAFALTTGSAAESLDGVAVPALAQRPLSAVEHVRLLGGAVDLLREAGSTYAAAHAACALWRFVQSEWMDPLQFAHDFAASQGVILKTFTALTLLFEKLSFASVPTSFEEEGTVNGDGTVPLTVQEQLMETMGVDSTDSPVSYQREVKENYLALRDLAVFVLKVEWIFGSANWDLVQLGSRIFRNFYMNAPEYLKDYGDSCLPLILNAQEALIEQAQAFKVARQTELEGFVFQYEEAQRKKRKKKLRIARLEKDEEELAFEAERSVYEERVEAAHQALLVAQSELSQVRAQQKIFSKLYSSGSRALDRLRGEVRHFLEEIQGAAAAHPDGPIASYSEVLRLYPDLDEKLTALQTAFKPVVSVLREKKEKVLLTEALKLLGDLLLLFNRIAEAKRVWNDTIDGLFNVMDACTEWKTVAADAVASLEPRLIPGILPAITALSKLSRFTSSQDWDGKAGYARMAAELCRIPFQGSFGHPVTVVGFAAYECVEVGGTFSMGLRKEALSARDLSSALHEVLQVLIAEKQFIAALPVVVLLEHFYAVYVGDASMWFSARLLRLRLLISSHLFAEAAAMLASIRFTVQEIHNQTFADALRSEYSKQTANLKDFETSENGLNFHAFAAYFNNLAPDDETRNAAALQWITAFPKEFETFAKGFKIALPKPVLSPEEQAAELERKAKAAEEAAAAAAAAKKGKGTKGKAEPEPVVEVEDSASEPMFSSYQITELHITCAHFLLETAMLEGRSTVPHAAKLQRLGSQGVEALGHATSLLYRTLPTPPPVVPPADAAPAAKPAKGAPAVPVVAVEPPPVVNLLTPENIKFVKNVTFLKLYGRIILLRNAYNIHVRAYKEVRTACTGVLDLLKSSALAQGLDGDIRGVLTQLWFASRDQLITVADRQARFKDVLQLSTQASREASMQLTGHWLRAFLLHRATGNFKLGQLPEALQDTQTCIAQYEANKLEDLQLVRCLCLQATIVREQALFADKATTVRAFLDSLALIRRAAEMAAALAHQSGAFNADSNVTYARADTAIKRHHLIAPVLQSLTDLHINEPNLSLHPTFNKKKLHQHMGIDIPSLQHEEAGSASPHKGISTTTATLRSSLSLHASNDASGEDAPQSSAQKFKLSHLRLAPVDRKEFVYSESEFGNIYLDENRALLTCQTLLCQVLDDARSAGLAGNSAFLQQYEPNALVNEQLATAESALKLARHCVYLPTPLRVATLTHVSKARIAKKSKFEGNSAEFLNTLVGPLTAALEIVIASKSTQLWGLVRTVCIELVEVYGDHDLDLGDEIAGQRLKMAVIYLLAAIKVSNQHAALTKNTIGLSSDPSFDANPSEELKKLVVSLSSSSATPDPAEQARLAAEEAEAAAAAAKAPAKGKAKPAPGAPVSGGTSLQPNGRDALNLFCSLLRERDPLYLDTAEQQLCADMHSLLRTAYPLYNSKCCLADCPNPTGALDVVSASVSTLYIPTKAPEAFTAILERQPNQLDYTKTGLYSHVSVFFLLGDAVSPTPAASSAGDGTNSKEPILTKLVLPRADVVFVEKSLREIRDRLLDAERKNYHTVVRSCQTEFGDVLVLLLGLLKNGIITQSKSGDLSPSSADGSGTSKGYQIAETKNATGASSYELTFQVGENNTPFAMKSSADLLLHFADVLCPDKDTEFLKDNNVCAFIRLAQGYRVVYK